MTFWNAQNIRDITSGRWLIRCDDQQPPSELRGVSTDTRTIKPGQIFIALRGENFDGHQFLMQAADGGAPLLIVDTPQVPAALQGRCAVLQVDDTLAALTQLAVVYRKNITGRVIGITGSAGKTTTKQLCHTILSSRYTGSASPKSFNNHIGVPLTILNADVRDQYLVVEIGTNAPGEIAALGRIAQPDIAIITTVGAVHVEKLGSVDGVLREKASLLSHMADGGVAIVNGDIPGLAAYRKIVTSMITFGRSEGSDLRLTDCRCDEAGSMFEINNRWKFRLPLLGEHNVFNAMAAIAAARTMNISEAQIAHALDTAAPADMRLETRTIGTGAGAVTLIIDCYNASPISMAAAIKVLDDMPSRGRRIAVLGDMLELGEQAPDYHRELGERVAGSTIDSAIFIGRLSLFAAETVLRKWDASRVHATPTLTDDGDDLLAAIEPGDTVLIKASRGMRLERLIPAIERRLDTLSARPTAVVPPVPPIIPASASRTSGR
jgi:UDP-N-acetylmuramoyl-tripeptide--D-alanyl-D-alanine ligase